MLASWQEELPLKSDVHFKERKFFPVSIDHIEKRGKNGKLACPETISIHLEYLHSCLTIIHWCYFSHRNKKWKNNSYCQSKPGWLIEGLLRWFYCTSVLAEVRVRVHNIHAYISYYDFLTIPLRFVAPSLNWLTKAAVVRGHKIGFLEEQKKQSNLRAYQIRKI